MKRDMELVRQILLDVEATPAKDLHGGRKLAVEGRDPYELTEHVRLLVDAGLLEASIRPVIGGPPHTRVHGLTWAGHEFLDAARNDTVWSKVRTWIANEGGQVPFSVVKDVTIEMGKAYFKARLGLPEG